MTASSDLPGTKLVRSTRNEGPHRPICPACQVKKSRSGSALYLSKVIDLALFTSPAQQLAPHLQNQYIWFCCPLNKDNRKGHLPQVRTLHLPPGQKTVYFDSSPAEPLLLNTTNNKISVYAVQKIANRSQHVEKNQRSYWRSEQAGRRCRNRYASLGPVPCTTTANIVTDRAQPEQAEGSADVRGSGTLLASQDHAHG